MDSQLDIDSDKALDGDGDDDSYSDRDSDTDVSLDRDKDRSLVSLLKWSNDLEELANPGILIDLSKGTFSLILGYFANLSE